MTDGMTPADLAAVTNSGGMFGGDNGAWWLIVLFLFIFSGNGWGNNKGVQDNYVLASDFANIERKIDGVNNGLCSGFYEQAQLANGTNQIVNNGFAQAELSRANAQAALVSQINALAMQQQSCCCENRQAISETNYNIATTSNATQAAITSAMQQIIQNDNCNYRALHDEIVANKIEDLQGRLAEKTQQINALQLASSQASQNEYLISRLQPTPIPSYPASSLYGYMSGCGCCNS